MNNIKIIIIKLMAGFSSYLEISLEPPGIKNNTKLSRLSAMAGSTWCVNTNDLRHKYISIALPQFLYCVSVCCIKWGIRIQRKRRPHISLNQTHPSPRGENHIGGVSNMCWASWL